LDFHHRDRATKTIAVSMMPNSGWRLERVREEIEKCDLLCANCHRIVEAELRSPEAQRAQWEVVR
jgi:hypothetical protein